MRRPSSAFALVLAFACTPRVPRTVTIRGSVVDGSTSQPLVMATVTLRDLTTGANADSLGVFVFQAPRPLGSQLELVVRRVGYAPTHVTVPLEPDSLQNVGRISVKPAPTDEHDVIIVPSPQKP